MEVWWPWIRGVLPLMLAGFVVYVLSRNRSKRPLLKVLSSLASTSSILLAIIGSAFLLSAQSCEEDRAPIGSPDGRHVVRLMIYGNVPAGTSLRVIERKSWSPIWREVSEAGSVGTSLEPIEPKLSWPDNDHLTIDYPESEEGTGFLCESKRMGAILIVCKTHKR